MVAGDCRGPESRPESVHYSSMIIRNMIFLCIGSHLVSYGTVEDMESCLAVYRTLSKPRLKKVINNSISLLQLLIHNTCCTVKCLGCAQEVL